MHGETADRILQTAKMLIADRGYAAFSYADIADRVQIRKASIHHHFPTKAALVVAVLEDHRERFMQAARAMTERIADPLSRLRTYVEYWERCIDDKSQPFCIAALLAAEMPGLPDEVQAGVRKYFTALGEWIQQTLHEGIRRDTLCLQRSTEEEAQLFMATVHGAMLSARAIGGCNLFHVLTSTAIERIRPQV